MAASVKDVSYLLHKGTYRIKALTPAAKERFAAILEMPAELVGEEKAEIFLTGIAPDSFPDWIEELQRHGLVTEDPPAAPPVEMWEW